MRRWWGLMLALLAVAGCTDAASEAPSGLETNPTSTLGTVSSTTAAPTTTTTNPTSSSAATTTTDASTTTTTAAPMSPAAVENGKGPSFLRYGPFGVVAVDAGVETTLLNDPVTMAWSDGAGGVLFTYGWEHPSAVFGLPKDAAEPSIVVPDYGGAIINLDGRAALVRYDDAETERCGYDSIRINDVETGAREDFFVCSGDGDVGWFPASYGGGLFVGVRWDASGSCGTDSGILFWDRSGAPVDVATNPYPVRLDEGPGVSTFIPCELDARLSPDGRLLAYRFRPDNKWPCPEYDEVSYEDWLKESRNIAGEIVVLDLETGAEVFRTESPAEERLADFDGRYLVLTTADQQGQVYTSRIADMAGNHPDFDVDGRVRLIWTHE